MEKLSQIGDDIQVAASSTYIFWKHVMQLLVEIGSVGTITFEEERQVIPEEKLSNIDGRYLKL